METNQMKILITGSNGFIAKNLIAELKNRGYRNLMLCNRGTSLEELEDFLTQCDILVHLAGGNRPGSEDEYFTENVGFTEKLVNILKKKKRKIHIIFSSTIQVGRHKHYEESKRRAEKILESYADESESSLTVFRIPNVFGKWCKPNYNSVVATFCYNISHHLEIRVDNPDTQMKLAYIDDVVNDFISYIGDGKRGMKEYARLSETYQITVGWLAQTIQSFQCEREQLQIPDVGSPLIKKLYSTYLSYLEPETYKYELNMNKDERGSFTEFLRSRQWGQISVNVAKPGIVKGNHWHHTKVEKFLVVKGMASIKLKHIITGEMTEYIVSGEKLEVVDIPVGYTHNITNIGNEDLITIMWANETFDKDKPDTYYEEV